MLRGENFKFEISVMETKILGGNVLAQIYIFNQKRREFSLAVNEIDEGRRRWGGGKANKICYNFVTHSTICEMSDFQHLINFSLSHEK